MGSEFIWLKIKAPQGDRETKAYSGGFDVSLEETSICVIVEASNKAWKGKPLSSSLKTLPLKTIGFRYDGLFQSRKTLVLGGADNGEAHN